jgi:hypothetical protein
MWILVRCIVYHHALFILYCSRCFWCSLRVSVLWIRVNVSHFTQYFLYWLKLNVKCINAGMCLMVQLWESSVKWATVITDLIHWILSISTIFLFLLVFFYFLSLLLISLWMVVMWCKQHVLLLVSNHWLSTIIIFLSVCIECRWW